MADIRAQMTRVREAANDMAGAAGDRLKGGTEKARETAGEAYADARDKTHRAATRANEILQEHPVAVVAGAVAAGALIAWLFPKSRAAIKTLPALATTAGARLLEAATAARDAAENSTDGLKGRADDAIHVVKDSATSLAATARDAAASARDTAIAADLPGKASRLADEVTAIVADKIDSISDALKARLPKH